MNTAHPIITKGIGGRRSWSNEKKDFQQLINFMTGKPVKIRKARGRDKVKRTLHEAMFRREVLKFFRKQMFTYWRIENSIAGKHGNGIPDFLFFTREPKFYWLELKSSKGKLGDKQVEFMDLCKKSGVNYIVARTIDDIKENI